MVYQTLTGGQHIDAIRFTLSGLTGVTTQNSQTPQGFILEQNYPNPFNSGTTIRFSLTSPSDVSLSICDILGRQVHRIHQPGLNAGAQQFHWDGRDAQGIDLASGIYYYTLEAGAQIARTKMLLVR
ncbi:T9SS type A sorting domain-containing protein [bacterium]|nr:T9SS type A sorting domain-containing protein [bacterium]